MFPIFIVIMCVLFFTCLMVGTVSDARNKKDRNGYNYYNSFTIPCPVCKNETRWGKNRACTIAVSTNIDELKKINVVCSECKADLAGLYFSHPFVRNAISESEHLKGAKELSMQFLEELAKLKEYTTAIGESYGREVQTVPTSSTGTKQRNNA